MHKGQVVTLLDGRRQATPPAHQVVTVTKICKDGVVFVELPNGVELSVQSDQIAEDGGRLGKEAMRHS